MRFNPNIHHRKSIRLRNYDYSRNGAYFVTICTYKRLELFGNVEDGQMRLNDVGSLVEEFWKKLPEKFEGIFLDEYCVMPNHFHGILIIDRFLKSKKSMHYKSGRDKSCPYMGNATLGEIIRYFKGRTTYEIRCSRRGDIYDAQKEIEMFTPMFAWQRNYYEHVIRDDSDINKIRYYISNNPSNWEVDENNLKNTR